MSVQQSILFQLLLKKLYAYSGTELSQGLSAMQKKKRKKNVYGCPKDEDSSKKKKKKLSPIELGEKTTGRGNCWLLLSTGKCKNCWLQFLLQGSIYLHHSDLTEQINFD